VRWLGRALVGSVAVHAAILVAAAQWRPDRKPEVEDAHSDDIELTSTQREPEPEKQPESEKEIVPIALITMPAVPPKAMIAERAPIVAEKDRGTRASSTSTSTSTSTESITTGAPRTETGDGSRLLSMRDPIRRPDGAGAADVLARIAEGGKPLEAPIPASGRLDPDGGGHARIDDLTFTGKVEPDGTVHIEDKPNAHVSIALPKPKAIGRALAKWAEDPYAYTKNQRQPGDDIENAPRGDGAVLTPKDQKPDSGGTVTIISGGFDVTAWLSQQVLGKAKGDVYAARKRAALDATRDERVEMRRRFRKDQLDHAEAIVRDSLGRLWASGLSIADKKQGIFELWDDCAETGEAPIVAAAVRARRDIIGFIRARLPAGSIDAFTAAELAAMNAHRTSTAPFAPYDDPPAAGE
jgi:hypothetical protein